jgi:hypothetical protein
MQFYMLRSMSRPASSPPPDASLKSDLDADSAADGEAAERYIGNRIADEDAPTGSDEVERLAAQILRAERRLKMIEELSERSMALARLAHDRAMDDGRRAAEAAGEPARPAATGAPASPNPDASAATYAKLSRTVRLCLDMEARADQALAALRDGAPAARAARRTRVERETRERREKVEHEVLAMMEPVIREAADSERREGELVAAVIERMTFDCAYDDLQDWDTVVTVGRLCADLGLKPDWNAWTVDGWPLPEGELFLQRPVWSPFNRVSDTPILARTQAICRATANRLE